VILALLFYRFHLLRAPWLLAVDDDDLRSRNLQRESNELEAVVAERDALLAALAHGQTRSQLVEQLRKLQPIARALPFRVYLTADEKERREILRAALAEARDWENETAKLIRELAPEYEAQFAKPPRLPRVGYFPKRSADANEKQKVIPAKPPTVAEMNRWKRGRQEALSEIIQECRASERRPSGAQARSGSGSPGSMPVARQHAGQTHAGRGSVVATQPGACGERIRLAASVAASKRSVSACLVAHAEQASHADGSASSPAPRRKDDGRHAGTPARPAGRDSWALARLCAVLKRARRDVDRSARAPVTTTRTSARSTEPDPA
jgi:hypothetical protein